MKRTQRVQSSRKEVHNRLRFFRDSARKKWPLAGQHEQEVETILPSPLLFPDRCG